MVLVGHPGSGKTSWAKWYYDKYEYISGDVYGTSEKVVKQVSRCLQGGLNAIVDATNVTRKRRNDIINACLIYRDRLNIRVYAVVFRVDIATCKLRAKERERLASLDPTSTLKHIPSIAFNTSASSFEEPSMIEGFTQIFEVFNH